MALLVGRALIGLGVAVGLMAGLKAIVLWFPPERVALANGWYIMLGALGALSATGPAEIAVQSVGWRGLFAILAAASAAVALLILLVVPEKKPAQVAGSSPKVSFFTVFRDTRFWRIAPLSDTGAGTAWSLQGLWAAPWLTDVAGLDRSTVVEHLTVMAAALSASALLLGSLAERLRRAGVSTEMFLAGTLAPWHTSSPGRSVSVKCHCASLDRPTRHGHTRLSLRGAKEPLDVLPLLHP